MSIRERAYSIFDRLTEEQLKGFVMLFENSVSAEDIPNEETLEAMREVEDMKLHPEKYKGYNDVDEMFKELLS